MIGELKASDNSVKGTLSQLARYARGVFAYLHAFTICGPSGSFDIHKEPERFVHVEI